MIRADEGPKAGTIGQGAGARAELAMAADIIEHSPVVLGQFIFPATGGGGPIVEYMTRNVSQFGYPAEAFISGQVSVFDDLIHPEDRGWLIARIGEAIAQSQPEISDQFRVLCRDGATRWIDGHMRFEPVAADGSRRGKGMLRDITEQKIAEIALRAERDFSAAVIDGVPGIFFVLDPDGRVIRVNPYLAEVTGQTVSELTGMSSLAVVAPDDKDLVDEKLREVAELGHTELEVGLPNRKTGAVRRFRIWARKIRLGEGGGILGVGADVTETREIEAARARLAAIVESSGDAIVGKSLDGVITSWNLGAERLHGYTAGEVIGRSIHLLVPEERRGEVDRVLATIASGGRVEAFQSERLTKAGERVPVWIAYSPIHDVDGVVVGASSIARDVSEQVRAAADLAYRDRLQHAVAVATAVLVGAEALEGGMEQALAIVGEALAVDRILVIHAPDQQGKQPSLQYAWQAADIPHRLNEAQFAEIRVAPALVDLWQGRLAEGLPVVAQLTDGEPSVREVLEQAHNQSMLMVPIRGRGGLWGNFGIDSCRARRDWTSSEIDTLGIFADAIGSVIEAARVRHSLERSEERFRLVSATSNDAIIICDAAGRVTYWNKAAERILGYTVEEALGKPIHDWIAPERFRRKARQMLPAFALTGGGAVIGTTQELAALRKDGVEIAIELSLASARVDGEWTAIAAIRDITDRKRHEAKIIEMARSDSLTGMANRTAFVDTLRQAIAGARRSGKSFAILYLDLDHFKDINDTLGHPVGDLLLVAVAERLRANIRATDTIARFGGDEFAVIGVDIEDATDAAVLAENLMKSISQPFSIAGVEIRTSTSVGIAMFGADAQDAETLLSYADLALYRAKADGRGAYRFFAEAMDREVRTRVTLGAELRAALDREELFLLYQPQVEIETRRIVCVEALIRWNHPTRGVLEPDAFIHTAERTGLITAVGEWVGREVCRQIRAWIDAGVEPVLVAMNLSGLQFKEPLELERELFEALAEADLSPRHVELELTETVLMEASHENNDLLLRLRRSGFRLAIDDFGTGFSSLDYLRRFPVDRIKIAQNFILDFDNVPGNVAIVKAVIAIAQALNVDVIAEGVETKEQLALLRTWGCRMVQGYYFSPPLQPEAIAGLMRDGGLVPEPRSRDPEASEEGV